MRTLLVITGLALAAAPLQSVEPSVVPGTRPLAGTIAFSSLAPRGWDLYVTDVETHRTHRLTHHPALDYNAAFAPDGWRIAFVSERDGNLEVYSINRDGSDLKRLTHDFALDDHPAWSPDGKHIAFVSTRQPAKTPGLAWNAVYVMNADGSGAHRLSPAGVADYSPTWSPRGDLIACASGSGVASGTDLYIMRPDGTGRRLVIKDGGWPAFAADGTGLFFHSRREGNWSIWRVNLDGSGLERITPKDIKTYTAHTAASGRWLVMAIERQGHRQIERLDLTTRQMAALTRDATDHWNPSVSPDGRYVVYHETSPGLLVPNVEHWGAPPGTSLQVLRIAGAFPAFSPDGRHLALTAGGFAGLDVMNTDGSGRKMAYAAKSGSVFSTSWAHEGGLIAFAEGETFGGPESKVDIATIRPDGTGYHQLTADVGNNAFPSFSPDGQWLVFRSGRGGSKNLYIMHPDGTGVRQLTKGKCADTMADWSPTGDWIVFASDRDGEFAIWLIKPDGSGLHKLVGGGGRHNHPYFSPDGQWVVFTSQRAGYSAEEVSLPHQFQPYGDLFIIQVDGSGLTRLTHNGFEEGTPAWGPPIDSRAP